MIETSRDFPFDHKAWNLVRILLPLMGVVQLSMTLVFAAFRPEGWSRIYRLPPTAAVVLSGMLALAWIALSILAYRPPSTPLRLIVRGVLWLRKTPLWLLILLPALPLLFLARSTWAGTLLLQAQVLLLTLTLYILAPSAWVAAKSRWLWVLAGVLIAAGLAMRFTAVINGAYIDEGHYLSLAIGRLRGEWISPNSGLPESITVHPAWGLLMMAIYGLWVKLFGIGLIQLRMLGYLGGLLALIPIYVSARQWWGPRAGIVAAAFAALSYFGLEASAARNAALPMLFFGLALAAHVTAFKQERPIWHLGVGVLAGLALEVHLLALALITAMGGVYLVDYVQRVRQNRRMVMNAPILFFALGVAPVLAADVAIRIMSLPDASNFLPALGSFSGTQTDVGQMVLARLATIVQRFQLMWELMPMETTIILLSIGAAILRRSPSDRHWLMLLLFNEIGYSLFMPVQVVSISYISFSIALLLSGTGALVTLGVQSEQTAGTLQERVLGVGLGVLLCAGTFLALDNMMVLHDQWEAARTPPTDAIKERVPAGATIIAHESYISYLLDYEILNTIGAGESSVPSRLVGMEHDAYWLDMLIKHWPAAQVNSHFGGGEDTLNPNTLVGSYFAARRAIHPVPLVWIAEDQNWNTSAPNGAMLQLAAYVPPTSTEAGESMILHTIWVTRGELAAATAIRWRLVDAGGSFIELDTLPLVGGWNGEESAAWSPYRFYDVTFTIRIPAGIPSGQYILQMLAQAPEELCQPDCEMDLIPVEISR